MRRLALEKVRFQPMAAGEPRVREQLARRGARALVVRERVPHEVARGLREVLPVGLVELERALAARDRAQHLGVGLADEGEVPAEQHVPGRREGASASSPSPRQGGTHEITPIDHTSALGPYGALRASTSGAA